MLDLHDQRFGSLVVFVKAPSDQKHSFWFCLCDCGGTKVVRGDSLTGGRTTSCGCKSPRFQRIAAPTYNTAHYRIRRGRGPAATHPCSSCGAPAHEWSYVGGCPDELAGKANGYRVVYCPNGDQHAECYVPRCTSCHGREDAALRSAA